MRDIVAAELSVLCASAGFEDVLIVAIVRGAAKVAATVSLIAAFFTLGGSR